MKLVDNPQGKVVNPRHPGNFSCRRNDLQSKVSVDLVERFHWLYLSNRHILIPAVQQNSLFPNHTGRSNQDT